METPSTQAKRLGAFEIATAVVLTAVIGAVEVLTVNGWISRGTANIAAMACFTAGLGAIGLKFYRCR